MKHESLNSLLWHLQYLTERRSALPNLNPLRYLISYYNVKGKHISLNPGGIKGTIHYAQANSIMGKSLISVKTFSS
jgi:hypothetical protein